MTIRTFDQWASERAQTLPLLSLKGAVIGVEASHFLNRFLSPSQEPLLSAVGGWPLGLRNLIESELAALREADITPVFVFNGLNTATKLDPFAAAITAIRGNVDGFEVYQKNQAAQARRLFGASGVIRPEDLYRYFQMILRDLKVDFIIAPYSACAQLAYLEHHPSQFIDAIWGSSEVLLFDVDKLITTVDFASPESTSRKTGEIHLENSKFAWVSRRSCEEDLGRISNDIFVDACLLSGSSMLPTFPPLENPQYNRRYTIRETVDMLVSLGKNVTAVCAHYQDDSQVREMGYLDKYRRTRMSIKHHVVLTADGNIELQDKEHAPGDVHEFIGQRLPEELYFYLSRGVIGPRSLEWLTSGVINLLPPLDGGESEEYRKLVRDQLTPWRTQSLGLLAHSLHRYYQRKDITVRCWFEGNSKSISLKDVQSPQESIAAWHVDDLLIKDKATQLKLSPGSLAYAVQSLSDVAFAAKTITVKSKDAPPVLKTEKEIICSALWRFLQLRGYLDEKHTLTSWGKVLHSILSSLDPADGHEEAAILAVELLRLELLNADSIFPSYTGGPSGGSEEDKRNSLLISRVACLGKLRHQSQGYAGPLSRHLLGYNSITNVVRESLRDLAEISLTTLLLNGKVDRDRDDWMDVSLGLPFLEENNCLLGVAVKTYFDELATKADSTSAPVKEEAKSKGSNWIAHCIDFADNIDTAFKLWDAVFAGVKAAGKEVKDGASWIEADRWLAGRR